MATIVRVAEANWDGNLNDGQGTVDIQQQDRVAFDRASRFDATESPANPETMAAGSIAACYAMTLAGQLSAESFTPDNIAVTARVTLERDLSDQPFVPNVDLEARATVNNIGYDQFMQLADAARLDCPIANLFAGAEVTLQAELFGG